MPVWIQAGFWGLVAGSALLFGALTGYYATLSKRLIASIMAFGSGVLISALVWPSIMAASGLAALLGYSAFSGFSPDITAMALALAAGGMLAMIVDTMIPVAFHETHDFAGLITAVGFLLSFLVSMVD